MPAKQKQTAEDIATDFLRKTGDAVMSNDFDAFRACFRLPHIADTFEGQNVIETEEELRAVFNNIRARFMEMGVTDFVRHVIAAEFQKDDLIVVTHETRLMHNNHLLQDPYPNYGSIALIDGEWKIVDAMYATNIPQLIDAFRARVNAKKDPALDS